VPCRLVDAEFVVTAAQVLNEGVPGGDGAQGAIAFQAAHRPQPSLEPPVVGLHRVVSVPVGDVAGGGQQLVKHPRVDRGALLR